MTLPTDKWLSIEKAREQVGVSRRTIYNWMDTGKVTWMRTAGGSRRILESSLWKPGQPDQADQSK